MENRIFDWAKEMNCAVTVCDKEGIILYMNDKAKETFARHGDLVGKSLMPCHSERSKEIIAHLLETGGVNAYTIDKGGVKKMIYQTLINQYFILKILFEKKTIINLIKLNKILMNLV